MNGKILKGLGIKPGPIFGVAISVGQKLKAIGIPTNEIIELLGDCYYNPASFLDHEVLSELAIKVTEENKVKEEMKQKDVKLNESPVQCEIWGQEGIDADTIQQMKTALHLEPAVVGALMPDAHLGYGLPIGGVLALDNAVSPYAVGMDIACRMCLSIYKDDGSLIETNSDVLKRALTYETAFGVGASFKKLREHAVMDDGTWDLNNFARSMKEEAHNQLGSSGSGNHFADFGIITIDADIDDLGVKKGQYLALVTHSGSRKLGHNICTKYSAIAKDICRLPDNAKNLAYLDLDTEAGLEYWELMNLAGRYAAANHELIHWKIAKAIGLQRLASFDNHHNFAWEEDYNGKRVIVHRKGATPAHKGALGVIPGSMADPTFLVRGLGNEKSINSASHGAGRAMSRKVANNTISRDAREKYLADNNVELMSGGMDESPQAYKDIRKVMAAQSDLVEVLGQFKPRIVMMAGENTMRKGKKQDKTTSGGP